MGLTFTPLGSRLDQMHNAGELNGHPKRSLTELSVQFGGADYVVLAVSNGGEQRIKYSLTISSVSNRVNRPDNQIASTSDLVSEKCLSCRSLRHSVAYILFYSRCFCSAANIFCRDDRSRVAVGLNRVGKVSRAGAIWTTRQMGVIPAKRVCIHRSIILAGQNEFAVLPGRNGPPQNENQNCAHLLKLFSLSQLVRASGVPKAP